MRVVQPPQPISVLPGERSVFLAGSIDMGSAVDWQGELLESLSASPGVLLNPRRPYWDPTWPSDATFPTFREQVEWELSGMEAADLIAFYFAAGSQAPIALLELGLAARTGKALVGCPSGYWRKGNVDLVCQRFRIPLVGSIPELAQSIRAFLSTGRLPQ